MWYENLDEMAEEMLDMFEEMNMRYDHVDYVEENEIDEEDFECDGDCEHCEFNDADEDGVEFNDINHPYHYASHGIETIDKIEAVIDGLPAKEAYLLSNILKYFDRCGYKDDAYKDLAKARAYSHRLVYGKWPE